MFAIPFCGSSSCVHSTCIRECFFLTVSGSQLIVLRGDCVNSDRVAVTKFAHEWPGVCILQPWPRYISCRGRKGVNARESMSDMFNGDASHSRCLFFQPRVGSLPSVRHCSHVFGFLKSNLPFLPARNCVRGKVRSHTWHVNGFAAASLELCSFFC